MKHYINVIADMKAGLLTIAGSILSGMAGHTWVEQANEIAGLVLTVVSIIGVIVGIVLTVKRIREKK
jgi:uncharacterized membrane protein YfcA